MFRSFHAVVALCAVFVLVEGALRADTPTPSSITYQGQLKFEGVGLDEDCDVIYTLYDAPEGGNVIEQLGTFGAPYVVTVQKGVFTTLLDFGEDAFDGGPRWLEVAVRRTTDGGAYSILAPRQCLTPTPYALYAKTGGDPTSLDEAYNTGGPGEGRTIYTNAGPLSLNGSGGLFVESNIGIGVNDPTERLELNGWLRLHEGGIIFPDGTMQTTAGGGVQGGGGVGDDGEPRGAPFWDAVDDTPNLLLSRPSLTTRVGIGTLLPQSRLHVANGDLTLTNGDLHCSGTIHAGAFSSNSPFIVEAPAGTTRLFIDDVTGYMALGNTMPQRMPLSLLHLADDIEEPIITLETNPDGTAASRFARINFMDRSNLVSTLLGDIAVAANVGGFPDGLVINSFSDANTILNPIGGRVGIGTGDPFRKLQVVDSNFFVTRFTGTNTDSAIVEFRSSSANATWEFAVSGSVGAFSGAIPPGTMYIYRQGIANALPFLIEPNGFVGINFPFSNPLVPPQAALEVRGTPGADGIMFPDGTLQTTAATNDHGSLNGLLDDDHPQYAHLPGRAGGQILNGGTGAGETLELHGSTMGGDVIINPTSGNVVIAGASSGNLGIGNANPFWSVDVVDTQAVARFITTNHTNGAVLELRNNTANPNYLGAINFNTSLNDFRGQIGYLGSNEMTFRVNGAEAMRIDDNGNVGIGTITPGEKLEVVGNVDISGTAFVDFVSSHSPLQLQTSGVTRIYIDDVTGNVGIDTNTPQEQLHVVNNARVDGTVYTEMVSSQGAPLELKTDDTTHLYIDDTTGNVGIGSPPPIPPEEALHVNGCVKADCYKVNGEKPIEVSALSAVANTAAVTLIPTPNGTVRVRPNQTGTQNVLIPVNVASSILGTPQELVRVRVCYRVSSSLSFINNTRARTTQDNGTFVNLLEDTTDRKSVPWNCYEVILSTPVAIDGPLFLQLELSIGGTGSSHDVEIGRVTVTVVDA